MYLEPDKPTILRAVSAAAGLLLISAAAAAQTTWYVDGACGDDAWSGRRPVCVAPDGPKRTIQAGMNLARTGDTVMVADGTYSGPGNKRLYFPPGENFLVRSAGGPQACTIDMQGSGNAFFLVIDETPEAEVRGFRIVNGTGMGGAFYFHHNSAVTVRGCILENNASAGAGGAILADNGASPKLVNCWLRGNATMGDGGAIAFFSSGVLTLEGCALTGNSAAGRGGGVFQGGGSLVVLDSTLADNFAGSGGGALHLAFALKAFVGNAIVWGNGPQPISGPADLIVAFSDIEGGWPGDGNIDLDPRFGVLGGGYVPLFSSPCVDAGRNDLVPPDLDMDLSGGPRIVDGNRDGQATVDMGAFEFRTRAVMQR